MPAKASLPIAEHSPDQLDALGPAFECVEHTAYIHRLSDKEMCAKLQIAQSKYRAHAYNIAKVQNLPLEMRQTFVQCYAQAVGLRAPKEASVRDQIRQAAKEAVAALLDLLTEDRT